LEDLKILKKERHYKGVVVLYPETLVPLLARLEAAEACIDVKADSYELWRKVAGK